MSKKCYCCLEEYDNSLNKIYICSLKNNCEYQLCENCIKTIMRTTRDNRCPACREKNTLFDDIIINIDSDSDSENDEMTAEEIDVTLDRYEENLENLDCCSLKIINCFITFHLLYLYSPYCKIFRNMCECMSYFHNSVMACLCLDQLNCRNLRNILTLIIDLLICICIILLGRLFFCIFWMNIDYYWKAEIGIFILSSIMAIITLIFFAVLAFFIMFVCVNILLCIFDFFCPVTLPYIAN